MEKIIHSYLSNNYKITLKTYVNYKLYDKISDKQVYIQDMTRDLSSIFNLTDEVIEPIWTKWLHIHMIAFENTLADLQHKIYEKTGLEITLENTNWSKLLTDANEKIINDMLHY